MTLIIIGTILNARKNILCWPIWTLASIVWIEYGITTRQNSIILTNVFMIFANVYGIYKWEKEAK